MSSPRIILSSSALLASLLLSGCSKENLPPEPVAIQEVPQTIQNAFQGAAPEAQTAAKEIATAVNGNDPAKAWMQLQELATRQDLTPEQRDAATRSMVSVGARLSEAAESGDAQAKALIEMHRARK